MPLDVTGVMGDRPNGMGSLDGAGASSEVHAGTEGVAMVVNDDAKDMKC